MVQAGQGLPAGDLTQLDTMRTAGTFEYHAREYGSGEIDPAPIIAAAETSQDQAHDGRPRRRRIRHLGLFAILLLIGASSSYIAIAGALTVPPAGLTNMISQLTASVGPALRDLGFAGAAPAHHAMPGPCQNESARCVELAGAAGIEPAHDGIKTRCLTAWLRPIRTAPLIKGDREPLTTPCTRFIAPRWPRQTSPHRRG